MTSATDCCVKATWLCTVVCALGASSGHAATSSKAVLTTTAPQIRHANLGTEEASQQVRHLANWVVDSHNNAGLPFSIVDKVGARVFIFSVDGVLRGVAPVLLGSARGDASAPGIGEKKLSNIRPEERTTPAGRFEAEIGHNMRGEEILWVDYAGAVSLHRVVTHNLKERRQHRLDTATASDNRITYGCINVSDDFFVRVVRPAFSGMRGIVYVLPEVLLVEDVFHSYRVNAANSALPLSGQ